MLNNSYNKVNPAKGEVERGARKSLLFDKDESKMIFASFELFV